jgi:hypothetical protein
MTTSINIHPEGYNKPNGILQTVITPYRRHNGSLWYTVELYLSDANCHNQSSTVTFFPDMEEHELSEMFPLAMWEKERGASS